MVDPNVAVPAHTNGNGQSNGSSVANGSTNGSGAGQPHGKHRRKKSTKGWDGEDIIGDADRNAFLPEEEGRYSPLVFLDSTYP